jgi:hypothetical protein
MIHIQNDGAVIAATNYWSSGLAHEGKIFVSVNAGGGPYSAAALRVFDDCGNWHAGRVRSLSR